MIRFHNVTKVYDQTVALDGLNLTIESGKIIVDGQELSSNRLAIKGKIGYVADGPDLFLRLTVNEFWGLVASS